MHNSHWIFYTTDFDIVFESFSKVNIFYFCRNIDRFPPVYGPRNFDEGPPRPWDERDLEQRPYLYKPTQSYDYGHTKSLNDPDPVSSTVFDMPSSSSLPFKKDSK